MDGHDCMLAAATRRGTYDRSKRRRADALGGAGVVRGERETSVQDGDDGVSDAGGDGGGTGGISDGATVALTASVPASSSMHATAENPPPRIWEPEQETHGNRSLASMFEDFLEAQDRGGIGVVMFGESSPLTFALGELRGKHAPLHDPCAMLSRSRRLPEQRRKSHPGHCSAEDIAYLEAKGAFMPPEEQLLDALFSAYLTRFYPLYTISNRAELLQAWNAKRIPWIMLHAICLIGATYCDASIIHRSPFSSRAQARSAYYEKAKVLWSTSYETDKFVLLETVIMLSFFGPRMNSIYNACSWLGFAFTLAESLGIHRRSSALGASNSDKGRMKRLWWTLVVRDAHCAALLGRPFRINIPECDVPMLSLDDFTSELEDGNVDSGLYQVEVARLVLLTRSIVKRRLHSHESSVDVEDLRQDLTAWETRVPSRLSWSTQGFRCGANVFATSLYLLYHQHIILLGLERAANQHPSPAVSLTTASGVEEGVANAAQAISSSASSLVTRGLLHRLPHEVFTGFFISGIVYYRQLRVKDHLLCQVARASMDNCQMLLHELCGTWDSAHWSVRIFEFLLSFTAPDRGEPLHSQYARASTGPEIDVNTFKEWYDQTYGNYQLHAKDLGAATSWELPDLSVPGTFNDFLLMSNFFAPSTGG